MEDIDDMEVTLYRMNRPCSTVETQTDDITDNFIPKTDMQTQTDIVSNCSYYKTNMETQTEITTTENAHQVDTSSSYSIIPELLFVPIGNSTFVDNDANNTMLYNEENDDHILSHDLGNISQGDQISDDENSETVELQNRFNRLMDRSPAYNRESSPVIPVTSGYRTRSTVANAAIRRTAGNTSTSLRTNASLNTTTHSSNTSFESANPISVSRTTTPTSATNASASSAPRVLTPVASTSGHQTNTAALDISIDSDFSDMEEFLLNIGDIATPATVMQKPQRFIYGRKSESYIDTCRIEKLPNPFTKHIAQFGNKDKKTNVCFTAKVIQRTSIIDTQNGAGENFSFAMVNVLDSDARVEDRTCIMRGTAITTNKLKAEQCTKLRTLSKTVKVGKIYTFKNVKMTKARDIPGCMRNLINHPNHILIDVTRDDIQFMEEVKMEDMSSDEDESTYGTQQSFQAHGPVINFEYTQNSRNFNNIDEMLKDQNSPSRLPFAVSMRKLMISPETTIRTTVYGCKQGSSLFFYAMAIGFDHTKVRQLCTICTTENTNRLAVCAIVRFYMKPSGKTGFETYISKIHNAHLRNELALC